MSEVDFCLPTESIMQLLDKTPPKTEFTLKNIHQSSPHKNNAAPYRASIQLIPNIVSAFTARASHLYTAVLADVPVNSSTDSSSSASENCPQAAAPDSLLFIARQFHLRAA